MPSELIKSFQRGKTQAKEWKVQFDEIQALCAAFDDNFVLSSPESFVDTQETHKLITFLGQISETKSPPVIITGPQRCGKSCTVQKIVEALNQEFGSNFALYKAYESQEQFLNWWEEAEFNSTKFFFFDNIYPIWSHFTLQSYQNLHQRSDFDHIIVVIIINSVEYHCLQISQENPKIRIFDQNSVDYNFHRSSVSEIGSILQNRAKLVDKLNIFTPEALETIGALSFGLPGLSLWFVRYLISYMETREKWNQISVSIIHKIAEYLGFHRALKVVIEHNLQRSQQDGSEPGQGFWHINHLLQENDDSSPLIQSLHQIKSVSKSWQPILKEMLFLSLHNNFIKRSELQEQTAVNDSSLTYQCQQLVKEKIINYEKRGREVFYELRSPVKESLELIFFDKQ